MKPTWIKVDANRWQGTIAGRTFILQRQRRTHSRRVYTSWVTIGRKPRATTTTTWYNIRERLPDGSMVELCELPGSLAQAKALVLWV
jgi:hypothetical protein